MDVWRLQTNTGKGKITDYCFSNKVAALGWSFCDNEDVTEEMRKSIKKFDEDYYREAQKHYKAFGSVKRLAKDVREGDLIWMRDENGIYYLGRVGKNSTWSFNNDAFEIDACNQISDVDWKKLEDEGDESCVPGAVATAFIKGSTFQRINKDGVFKYSGLLYDELAGTDFYSDIRIDFNEDTFYSLLSPSDCEDLLYSWLYSEYGYICIPSSNKIGTPNYECVLLDPENGERIFIQVKKGDDSETNKIDAENYKDLNGKIWFLKTKGRVLHIENYSDRMKEADSTKLFEFACSEEAKNIIAPNIKKWVQFMCNEIEKKMDVINKGIIFDTNKSYEINGEKEMFANNQIIAWGPSSKYIDSFNVNDCVLYYSKGKGIIAIGKIISTPKGNENKKFCNVEMIIPAQDCDDAEHCISASELKKELGKNFYFASTRKAPFISEDEVEKLVELLKKKQSKV